MCGLLDFLSPQKPTSNFHFKPELEHEDPMPLLNYIYIFFIYLFIFVLVEKAL